MFRKWIAVVLLVLAASPVTAPFQTFVVGHATANNDLVPAVHTMVICASNESDPGSLLVPPVRTQPGHLTVVPHVDPVVTSFIPSSALVSRVPLVAAPPWPGGDPVSLATVLRV